LARLFLYWAGVHGANKWIAIGHAKAGFLSFHVNAHGILNGQPETYYKELNEGALKGYSSQGNADRQTAYFLGMYLRIVRAIDFAKQVLTVETIVPEPEIAIVRIGRQKFRLP